MFKYETSQNFMKNDSIIFNLNDVSYIDCHDITQLKILVVLKNNKEIPLEGIHALELIMQVKPSLLEGKRLVWPRFVWIIHNVFTHPLTQFFALLKLYKLAFWIHDATVPKPLIKIKLHKPKCK